MSKADASARVHPATALVPPPPRVRGALRAAASDFYFNSWRLVPANIVWALVLGLSYLAYLAWPIWLFVTIPLLAVPTAGIYRLAALVVRSRSVSFSDALAMGRRRFASAFAAGIVISLATGMFIGNIGLGLTSDSPIGWSLATLAAWGLAIVIVGSIVFWPLFADPDRDDRSLLDRVRLAGLLIVAFPLRFAALGLVTVLIVLLSAVAAAALVTITISYCALVGAHYVLPAADRLEMRRSSASVVRH